MSFDVFLYDFFRVFVGLYYRQLVYKRYKGSIIHPKLVRLPQLSSVLYFSLKYKKLPRFDKFIKK